MSQQNHLDGNVALTQKPSKYIFVTSKMEKTLCGFSAWVRSTLILLGEKASIKRKKHLINKVSLTEDQKKEISVFFKKHYGKKVPFKWHRLYQSYTGTFRYDYFPEILFSTKLEPKLNPYREAEFLSDKNLLETFFGSVDRLHIPKTIISCVKGRLRTGSIEMITREKAEVLLKDVGKCVIKKTTETCSGRDVAVCNIKDGVDKKNGIPVAELLKQFGDNFVVQEFVEQFAPMAKLNHSSLNTFRVATYILDGEIHHCPPVLRLGRYGFEKDNIHHGGVGVQISEDGVLGDVAYSEQGEEYYEHPDSHVTFAGYQISEFSEILEKAHELHARLPYLGFVSWDFSLDQDGIPVLIEVNTYRQSAGICQRFTGKSLFGENTAKMLEMIRE
jgi:hypothetical protein